jgi:tRNA(Ile)-lysidine synthase
MHSLSSEVAAVLARFACRRLAVAFSGGLDSCVLAHLLSGLAPELGLSVELAYFNHCLRGAESEAEERFCRGFAARLGLPLQVGRWGEPVPGEAAARAARYRWLGEVALEGGHEAVLTAHHRRDQAETLLLRMLRGAGLRGLCSMRQSAALPEQAAGARPVLLLRPLLEAPRESLRAHALSAGFEPFEDSSNRSGAFLRNRVRQRLLPLLEELSPGAERRLARLARHAAEECDALDLLLGRSLATQLSAGEGWAVLPRRWLCEPAALARRAALAACVQAGLAEGAVRGRPLADLLAAARAQATGQKQFRLATQSVACLTAGHLTVLRGPPWVPAAAPEPGLLPEKDPRVRERLDVWLEADAAAGPLWIRTRRRGERLGPAGPPLKELFAERGVPRFLRERYPLVEDAQGLLLVPGLWQRPGTSAVRARFGPSWPTPLLPREPNQ